MNREIVNAGAGGSIYPLTGDVLSSAGNPTVKVAGLQGISVQAGVPPAGSRLTYNQNANQWQALVNAILFVNGLPISDDYEVTVNNNPIQVCIISVNGVTVVTIVEDVTGPIKVNGVIV